MYDLWIGTVHSLNTSVHDYSSFTNCESCKIYYFLFVLFLWLFPWFLYSRILLLSQFLSRVYDLFFFIPVISFMHDYSCSIILYNWIVVENNFLCLSHLYSRLFVFCLYSRHVLSRILLLSRFVSLNYYLFTIRGSIHVSSKHNMWVVYIRRLILIVVCVYSCDSYIHDSSSITSLESCFLLYDLFWFVIIEFCE